MMNEAWKKSVGPGEPRFCLTMQEKHLLLSWAMVQKIEAAEDFLSIRFLCEYGEITLSPQESLRELFEMMQYERVSWIDGTALHCKIENM